MTDAPEYTDEQIRDMRRNRRRTACQGKEAFTSRAVAEQVARRKKNNAYKCDGCGKWHVGGQAWLQPKRR